MKNRHDCYFNSRALCLNKRLAVSTAVREWGHCLGGVLWESSMASVRVRKDRHCLLCTPCARRIAVLIFLFNAVDVVEHPLNGNHQRVHVKGGGDQLVNQVRHLDGSKDHQAGHALCIEWHKQSFGLQLAQKNFLS
jgi:hypothetical protein